MRGARLSAILPFLPALAALAAYMNALPASFQWDDFNVIVDYSPVHSLSAWTGELAGGIRPFLKLTYALNWSLSPAPFGFHAVNNLIHACNAILIFLLVRRLAEKYGAPGKAEWLALCASMVFALHPVRTEAVTYVSGRSISLMALFYLSSLHAWATGVGSGSRLMKNILSPAIFLLALLTRETAVTLPLMLVLWGVCVEGMTTGGAFRAAKVHFALLAVAVFAAFALGRPVTLYLQALSDFEGSSLLLRQAHGVAYLLTRFFTLTGQNIDPDLPENVPLTPFSALEALLLPAMVLAGVILARRRNPAGLGLLWFVLHILPTNTLIPRYDVASERHLYLAGAGLEWALLLPLAVIASSRRKIAVALAAALAVALCAATVARNLDYLTETTLWEDTVEKSPAKARPRVNLGHAYLAEGRVDDARAQFQKALALDPANETAANNLRVLDWRTVR